MIKSEVFDMLGLVPGDELPGFSSIGSYPLVYLCEDGEFLCDECCNTEASHFYGYCWDVVSVGVHWEGDPIQCGNCCHLIQPAYIQEGEE